MCLPLRVCVEVLSTRYHFANTFVTCQNAHTLASLRQEISWLQQFNSALCHNVYMFLFVKLGYATWNIVHCGVRLLLCRELSECPGGQVSTHPGG